MIVSQCFVWFIVYSVVGWIWESTYCTIVEHKWQNRGFLYGPACPIYGVGIVGIMIFWRGLLQQGITPTWWEVFLVAMVGSAILEYATHWALERLFHAYWWDYSNMPLNLNGRICLPASVFFGLGGLLVVYVLYEPTVRIIASANPLAAEAVSLILMAVMAADAAITASSLASIARAAATINNGVNAHMDQFVAGVETRRAEIESGMQETRAAIEGEVASKAAAIEQRRQEAKAQREQRKADASRTRAEERERFARELRAMQIGQLGSAARRAMGAVSPDRLPDTPEREQLVQLWRAMLDQENGRS